MALLQHRRAPYCRLSSEVKLRKAGPSPALCPSGLRPQHRVREEARPGRRGAEGRTSPAGRATQKGLQRPGSYRPLAPRAAAAAHDITARGAHAPPGARPLPVPAWGRAGAGAAAPAAARPPSRPPERPRPPYLIPPPSPAPAPRPAGNRMAESEAETPSTPGEFESKYFEYNGVRLPPFCRGKMEEIANFPVRDSDVWIVTYPKSGR